MYHSYLRGKQYELLAIRGSIDKISEGNIVPIIEPVRASSRDILKCIECLRDIGSDYVVIANPQNGDLVGNQLQLEILIDSLIDKDPDIELGFIVDDGTTQDQLNSFIAKYDEQAISIIHHGRFNDVQGMIDCLNNSNRLNKHIFIESSVSESYRNNFSDFSRVIIRDDFTRRAPNAEYANHLDEFFSDTYKIYLEHGYVGFGDFSIVGDHYSEGGGQAITAVVHITYDDSMRDGDIYIRHFLSEPRTVADEVPILLEESLSKLKDFLIDNPEILEWSSSCEQIMGIYENGCQSNLATMKKLSMSHHFELMHRLTNEV